AQVSGTRKQFCLPQESLAIVGLDGQDLGENGSGLLDVAQRKENSTAKVLQAQILRVQGDRAVDVHKRFVELVECEIGLRHSPVGFSVLRVAAQGSLKLLNGIVEEPLADEFVALENLCLDRHLSGGSLRVAGRGQNHQNNR